MYLCHVAFEMSLARVASAFDRDRSTVGYACHSVEDRRENPQFDAWVDALEPALREAPAPPSNRAKEYA
jgi:chromosomal replication initiation ATPase DnaA